jgi:hypothetical protein
MQVFRPDIFKERKRDPKKLWLDKAVWNLVAGGFRK